jgi:hypothetical protein
MGVGKEMIGAIADSAKSKDSDRVMETMATQQQQQQEKETAASQAVSDYTNVRASLKRSEITPKGSVKPFVNGATPEFVNFRDKLKSPTKK